MQVIHVHVQVKPQSIEAFRQATVENARNSAREPGIARFDVIQDASNPAHFVLVEVYRHSDARAQHRATAHYQKWRDAVEDMIAEPRTSTEFRSVFPDDEGW
jgi:(4S)-4-hydroxy-5-phosphonooxypentane-2,3-dione isomerase